MEFCLSYFFIADSSAICVVYIAVTTALLCTCLFILRVRAAFVHNNICFCGDEKKFYSGSEPLLFNYQCFCEFACNAVVQKHGNLD